VLLVSRILEASRATAPLKGKPQIKRATPGRNDPCACGSGRKYKNCCADKDRNLSFQDDFALTQFRRGLKFETQGRDDEAIEAYHVAAASGHGSEAMSRIGHLYAKR
jgi:hypothetical protein